MSEEQRSRTKRRHFLKATGTGIGITVTAGCTGSLGGDDGGGGSTTTEDDTTTASSNGNGDPITIAGLQPLSGPFSVYGPRHTKGAKFAVQQINANGGVRGRKLQLKTVDTKSDAKTAVTAFTRLIEQNNAVAGIGPGASEVAIRTGDIAEKRQVPLYLHAAGAVAVVPKDARYTFRTALPATPTVARAQAQIIKSKGYTNIGVIFEDGVWGDEYKAAMNEYFPDGLNITKDSAPITQTDFVPLLRRFPNDVEVILGTAHPAGVSTLYPQVYDIGLNPDLFLGAITPMVADYNAIGDSIQKSFASFNSTDMYSDDYAKVAEKFNQKMGGLFDHAQVNGYVAIQLIADSIKQAGSTDPADIATATRNGTFDTLYGNPVEYTKWGEPKNSVLIHNSFNVGSSPDHWPGGSFTPEEFHRSDPLPAFEPGSLGLE